jgi:hypothetical protein
MAEIKSTLDLIMEKTKGLTLSPKEKEEIRREEWAKKARGWIQKFLDGWIDMDKVKSELPGQEAPSGWEKILQTEIISPLDPEEDNEKRFQLITEFLELPGEPFLKILSVFKQRVEGEKVHLMEQSIKRLSDQGISGSAVLPNPDRDPSWIQFITQERKAVKEMMADL